jgi:hypothetical protein
MKTKIDIINRPEFQSALWVCIEKTIEACNSCGATYDELYLENKWSKRLLDMKGIENATSDMIVKYAEMNFAF